jgi:hypothetical protein
MEKKRFSAVHTIVLIMLVFTRIIVPKYQTYLWAIEHTNYLNVRI